MCYYRLPVTNVPANRPPAPVKTPLFESREPADRPQFGMAALMKFITGLCVVFALVARIVAETKALEIGIGVAAITVGTLITLRTVDYLAYREIHDRHAPEPE